MRTLQVLRQVLPLPFLRVGHLLAVEHSGGGSGGGSSDDPSSASEQSAAAGQSAAWQQPPDERWRRAWFVLDADSLRTAPDPQRQSTGEAPRGKI